MATNEYVVLVDEWRQITKVNDAGAAVSWKDHHKGDKVSLDEEHDDVLRLTEAGALRLVDAESEESEESETVEPVVVDDPVDYEALSFDDLKALAESRGLSKAGGKSDIIGRLHDQDAGA